MGGQEAQHPWMAQMMNNPAFMQQAMAFTQQMMNPQAQAQTGDANATAAPPAPAPAFNPMAFNAGGPPNFMQMMHQMQQMQQMGAGQQGTGTAPGTGTAEAAVPEAVPESVQKMRFASQLVQLA